jgi:hypothetical protein
MDYVLGCKHAPDGRLVSSGLRGQCRQPRVIVCCEDQRQPIGFGQSPIPGLLDEVVSLCAEHIGLMMRLPTLVLAATASGAMAGGRLGDPVPIARNFLVGVFEWFGELGLFCARLIRTALTPPYEFGELLRQCDAIGSKSLPLVALAGAATGVVLSLQTRDSLVRFGAKAFLPAVIVFSIIKESGPIITGLIVSGRVGAGIGAELGSMKVTEQIDAMEASAVDPYKFLVPSVAS